MEIAKWIMDHIRQASSIIVHKNRDTEDNLSGKKLLLLQKRWVFELVNRLQRIQRYIYHSKTIILIILWAKYLQAFSINIGIRHWISSKLSGITY